MNKTSLQILLLSVLTMSSCTTTEVKQLNQNKELAQKSLKQNELTQFKEVSTWPGWLCADFIDENRNESAWYRPIIGKSDLVIYDQKCEYWESHPPDEEK